MKHKLRRIWVWCKTEETGINCVSVHRYPYSVMNSQARKKAKKIRAKYPEKRFKPIVQGNLNLRKPIRCPDCGKRMKPRVRDCGDGGCLHIYLPPHKKAIKDHGAEIAQKRKLVSLHS